MADIQQTLGFDASQAIETINLLNTALGTLNSMLGTTGSTISNWNSVGSQAVTQFNSMKTAAEAARKAIEALNGAQQKAAAGAAKVESSPVNQVAAPPPVDMSNYIRQIEAMGKTLGDVPKKASEASKRAYASAISGLADFVSKNKISLDAFSAAWNNNGQVVTGAANKLANMCQTVKTAHQNMAKSAGGFLSGLASAWSTVARVASGLVLYQAINAIIGAFKQGIVAAVEFGKQVVEIAIVSNKSFKVSANDMEQISARLIDLSKTYGTAVKDVAEGYYRTISSLVGSSIDIVMILNQALQLSVATNTDLASSTDLLTGVMNSYGLSASMAGEMTGMFIKSVELGRAHLGEFANIMGRVYPMAKEMGISIEEASAAMITMTNTGLRADTAVTQLRGILVQLLKPTKELTELMNTKWGTSNAVEALRLFGGLAPLLQALSKETGGANSEMVQFFKNVRALTGVLGLTGASLSKNMRDNTEALQGAGSAYANWAAKLALDTPAKKAEIAWNALRVEFMRLGTDALPLIAKLSEVTATYFEGVRIGFKTLFGGGVPWEDLARKLNATKEKAAIKDAEIEAKMSRIQARKIDEAITQNERFFNSLNKLRSNDLQNMEKYNQAFIDTTKKRLTSLLETQRVVITKLEEMMSASAAKMKNIDKTIASEKETWGNRQWELEKTHLQSLGDSYVVNAEKNKSSQLEQQALSIMRKATTDEELDAAKKLLEQARGFAEKVTDNNMSIHNSTKPLIEDKNREKRIFDELIRIEDRRKQITEEQQKAASAQLQTEISLYTEYTLLVDKLAEKLKLLVDLKNKSPEQLKAGIVEAKQLMAELSTKMKEGISGDPASTKKLGMTDQIGMKAAALSELPIIAQTWEKQMNAATDQIAIHLTGKMAKAFPDVTTRQQLQDAAAAKGTELKEKDQELNKLNTKIRAYTDNVKSYIQTIQVMAEKTTDSVTRAATGGGMTGMTTVYTPSKWIKDYKELQKVGEAAAKAMNTKDEAVAMEAWNKGLEEWKTKTKNGTDGAKNMNNALQTTDNLLKDLIQSENKYDPKAASDLIEATDKVKEEFKYLTDEVKNAGAALETKLNAPVIEMNELLELINTQSLPDMGKAINADSVEMIDLTSQTSAAAGQMERLARAAAAAAAASSGGGGGGGEFDSEYSASGGFAGRGTDTIPAMLTPGEYIMNAESARQFSSQLQAMNAGIRPVFRDKGGSVTNVGDINVSVNGGENTHQTAREIAQVVRREIRRGTARLD